MYRSTTLPRENATAQTIFDQTAKQKGDRALPTRRSRDPTPRRTKNAKTTADLEVSIDGHNVTALVDTGADYSVLSGQLAARMKKVSTTWTGPQVRTAGGHLITPSGRCTARVKIQGHTYLATFVILDQCSRDVILGMDFLTDNEAVINLRTKSIAFSTKYSIDHTGSFEREMPLRILDDHITIPPQSSIMVSVSANSPACATGVVEAKPLLLVHRAIAVARGVLRLEEGRAEVFLTNFGTEHQHLNKGTTVATFDEVAEVSNSSSIEALASTVPAHASSSTEFDVNPALPQEKQQSLRALLERYSDNFSSSSKIRQTPIAKHRILTHEGTRPLRQSPYRVSSKERESIRLQVKEMLDDDIIQPSRSPWAAPVVLVKKKDGTLRFCVDYRRLNSVTKKDVYPLPRIDDALDRLCDAKYFSSMDLKTGYWQIEVDERDREKTAFITPDGLYEFKVMPFGLCSAPATFQRVMDTVLADLKWQTCLVYLDDVVVFAPNFDEHLRRLEAVFMAIKSSGLTLKAEKCRFAYEELKFLGHVISSEGVRPDPQKTAAVANFPQPRDKKSVRRFLGLCAYYRRFVQGFSKIAEPLTRLTKDDAPFEWKDDQERAFRELQQRLQSSPVLAHFDAHADTEIHTDASSVGLGAVLVQLQNGHERVIAYASRSLSKAETNYSATEKECLAIVWATSKFRPYLYGRCFKVVTDHHALCWLANLKDPSGRLARWSLRLQEFDITVTYKSGRKHSDADCLSRAPVGPPPEETDDEAFLGAITASDFADKQGEDTELREVIRYLQGEIAEAPRLFKRTAPTFYLHNGVLVKKNFGPNKRQLLLVVPQSLREEILQASHDDPVSGHLGVTRTLHRIQEKYFWPRLTCDVRHYVKTCRDCQRRKVPPTKPAGLLQPVETPARPFQQVGMDLLGPFPTSASQNKWIVVATDYLTRYAETTALPRGTAVEVAKFFIHQIVLRHGAPEVVITDRGTAFTADLMQSILRFSYTDHRKTTAYHPQTNGLTERLNKTLADMLSMYVDVEHKTWDDVLPYVTFAYNTAVQETTRMTPFSLLYGRDPITMLDAMLPHVEDDGLNEDVAAFLQRAEEARQLARIHIKNQQRYDTRRYNLRRRDAEYRPGDQVWLWTPIRRRGLSEKLLRRYFGPYKIIRRVGELNYEIVPDSATQPSGRRTSPEVVHVVRLKPYYPR